MPTMDSSPISSPYVSRGLAELAVVAVSRIGEDRGPGNAIGDCPLKLFGGAERFGAEDDFVRSPGLPTALRVLAPGFRQVELVGNRKAGGVGAGREADGHQAVVLFADLSAVLPGEADGVFAFFRKTSIVGCLVGDGMAAGHFREDVLADGLEEDLVIPGRNGDDMVQGQVSALDITRVKTGGHGYHALALSGLLAWAWRGGRLRGHAKRTLCV
jgi:hypothetical protein